MPRKVLRHPRSVEDMLGEIYALRKALKRANLLLSQYGIPTIPVGWGIDFKKKNTKG